MSHYGSVLTDISTEYDSVHHQWRFGDPHKKTGEPDRHDCEIKIVNGIEVAPGPTGTVSVAGSWAKLLNSSISDCLPCHWQSRPTGGHCCKHSRVRSLAYSSCVVERANPVQSRSLYGAVFLLFFGSCFRAMMKQACRQTLKSLAAECLVGVRLGLLNFLTPVCVDWLFWLLAFGAGGCLFWTDVVDTLPGSGLVGWCLESVFFADTNTATIFIPHPMSIWE